MLNKLIDIKDPSLHSFPLPGITKNPSAIKMHIFDYGY